MIEAGIHGVVLLGTVGENTALEYEEKLTVVREMLGVVARPHSGADRRGRVHDRARPAVMRATSRSSAIDGLMVLPGMVYKSDERETMTHFRDGRARPPGCRS